MADDGDYDDDGNFHDVYRESRLNLLKGDDATVSISEALAFHLHELCPDADAGVLRSMAKCKASSDEETARIIRDITNSCIDSLMGDGASKGSSVAIPRITTLVKDSLSGVLRTYGSRYGVDEVIVGISALDVGSKGETNEKILFYPFPLSPSITRSITSSMLVQSTSAYGNAIYLCEFPSLSLGFGSGGLLVCRAKLGQVKEITRDELVPSDGFDTLVLPQEKLRRAATNQPGRVFVVGDASNVVPVCLVHLNENLAAPHVLQSLHRADFVSTGMDAIVKRKKPNKGGGASSAFNSYQSNHTTAAGPSNGYHSSTNPRSRHIVQLQADPRNADICSICTFALLEASMYDDEEDDSAASSVRTWSQLGECGHVFHEKCLEELMRATPTHIQCPQCKRIYGTKMGNQPTSATMQHTTVSMKLAGYESVDTIQITYQVKGGVQGPEHPNPGRPFHPNGFPRVAYLPNNEHGRKVLRLLKRAFEQRLIFTVGRSTTTGADNVVTWNDIHHKTSPYPGEHGYPDPGYLDRVADDLAQHGIAE